MRTYSDNVRWLMWFAPFSTHAVGAAYLAPFFIGHGLSLTEMFVLQSMFSAAYLLLEVPSGHFADRNGRAFSIKLSVPMASVALIAYGLSSEFWQFVLCELVLALTSSLISGADDALLIDSLNADCNGGDYVRISQKIKAYRYIAVTVGVPVAFVLVKYIGFGATLVADGVLAGFAFLFARRLTEAPAYEVGDHSSEQLSPWRATKRLAHNVEARWIIALATFLSASTYFAFWLSTPYFLNLGLDVLWFGAILAGRSLWKAWLSGRFHCERRIRRDMYGFAILAGAVYFAMASDQLWLVWVVLGHDVVEALHSQPLKKRVNDHFDQANRAMLNSAMSLVQRLFVTVTGPLIGMIASSYGLSVAFIVAGATCMTLVLLVMFRLDRLGTFERR